MTRAIARFFGASPIADRIDKNIRAFKDKVIGDLSDGAGILELKYDEAVSAPFDARPGFQKHGGVCCVVTLVG